MIPFVMLRTSPVPGTILDSKNVWQDKLRGIRWDKTNDSWLISTSEGFIRSDEAFEKVPEEIKSGITPPVSPMGVNVFEPCGQNEWLIGSFSGMYVWDLKNGTVKDYFTQENLAPGRSGRPTSDHLVTGYSKDFDSGSIVFDYSKGSSHPIPMPDILKQQRMSLWNFALELHVGRCYNPILGPFSSLFIFLVGAILITVLVTGLILHSRYKSHK